MDAPPRLGRRPRDRHRRIGGPPPTARTRSPLPVPPARVAPCPAGTPAERSSRPRACSLGPVPKAVAVGNDDLSGDGEAAATCRPASPSPCGRRRRSPAPASPRAHPPAAGARWSRRWRAPESLAFVERAHRPTDRPQSHWGSALTAAPRRAVRRRIGRVRRPAWGRSMEGAGWSVANPSMCRAGAASWLGQCSAAGLVQARPLGRFA